MYMPSRIFITEPDCDGTEDRNSGHAKAVGL